MPPRQSRNGSNWGATPDAASVLHVTVEVGVGRTTTGPTHGLAGLINALGSA